MNDDATDTMIAERQAHTRAILDAAEEVRMPALRFIMARSLVVHSATPERADLYGQIRWLLRQTSAGNVGDWEVHTTQNIRYVLEHTERLPYLLRKLYNATSESLDAVEALEAAREAAEKWLQRKRTVEILKGSLWGV